MKVRLLNVTHSAMCYAGLLVGCTHVHEAVTHQMVRPYLKRIMTNEITASLVADPTMSELISGLDAYAELVLRRFENVAVKDTLDRVAMDGSEKFRVQGRAVVMEGLADERSVRGFALFVATWAHFLKKAVENGDKVKDASAQLVSAPWTVNGGGLEAFLDVEEVFGVLAQHEGFRSAVAREFDDIEQSGVEATLLGYIFGAGNNSNGDLANAHRDVSRVSGSFHALDEVCIPEEAQPDEAVAFVPLEA
jgi:mannitol 2-dehydrogenase